MHIAACIINQCFKEVSADFLVLGSKPILGGIELTKKMSSKKFRAFAASLAAAALLWGAPAALPSAAPVAHADAITDIIGGIIGVSTTYSEYLDKMLAMGNSPDQQMAMLNSDMDENGRDLNEAHNEVVTRVMNQLIENADYAMAADSLPFRWRVNDSDQFNAYCSAMDYVSVNRGLLEAINNNPDELAGVLGHELTHGLKQHLQYSVAKQAATEYGASLLENNVGVLEGTLLNILVNYNTAKNYNAPLEAEADRYGFYYMTTAGFNPGGFAAMVTKMPDSPGESLLNPDDHPETSKRLERSLKWMQDYSCGHVTAVTDETTGATTVYIDETPFYTATVMSPEEMAAAGEVYSAKERAYFVAGGIAKGFHDNRLATLWHFKALPNGNYDFLTDSDAYTPLKNAVNYAGSGAELERLVTLAYSNERKTGARDEMLEKENEMKEDIAKDRKKAMANTDENISTYEDKSDRYNVLGLTHLATHEANRLLACNPYDSAKAFAHGELGWAKYKEGNYDEAVKEHQTAGAINPSSGWNYMRLSYAQYAAGDYDVALVSSQKAEQVSPGKYYGNHVVAGLIYDKRGNQSAAMSEFSRALSVSSDAASDIPEEYNAMIADNAERVAAKYDN